MSPATSLSATVYIRPVGTGSSPGGLAHGKSHRSPAYPPSPDPVPPPRSRPMGIDNTPDHAPSPASPHPASAGTRTPVDLVHDGRRTTGIATVAGRTDLPLLVCLPGGGYNAHYFDVPGSSFLDVAVANGFSAVALDRPGYGGSDPAPDGEEVFAANAAVLDGAIGALWAGHGGERPGVVIVSHS